MTHSSSVSSQLSGLLFHVWIQRVGGDSSSSNVSPICLLGPGNLHFVLTASFFFDILTIGRKPAIYTLWMRHLLCLMF